MAEPVHIDELFLTAEDQRTLEEMTPALEMLKKNVGKLEAAGFDVTVQKQDLDKAVKLRDGALRELTRK